MTGKQTLILIGVVTLIFFAMGGVVYYTQSSGGAAQLNTAKRFTAKPGTTRENAVALSSNKRPSQLGESEPATSRSEQGRPVPVRSLSPQPADPDEPPSAAQVRKALNSLSPEAGIETIEAQLTLPQNPGDAAEYHAALGILYTQTDPPNNAKALEAFGKARALAISETQRCAIAEKEAQFHLAQHDVESAQKTLESTLKACDEKHVYAMRLKLLLGQTHEEAGAPKEAEQAYRQVLSTAKAQWAALGTPACDITRVAALHLARLLRSTSRSQEASELAQHFKKELDRFEATPQETPAAPSTETERN